MSPDKNTSPSLNATCLIALLAMSFLNSGCGNEAVDEELLPSLKASNIVTVSGISSGGYMASQYLVAFSNSVSGAGIVAAGPWACAQGDITRALKECASGAGIDIGALHTLAEAKAKDKLIDATENLRDSRLLLFHGSKDAVVGAEVFELSRRWFAHYVKEANINVITAVPAAHGWPTTDYGTECASFIAPYIMGCGYDLAGNIVSHLHPDPSPPAKATQSLHRFDQRPFGDANLANFGYVYIPEYCSSNADCRIHIFFHGCNQSANTIGTTLIENAGFNRWAESNKLIVLYPQVEKSTASPMNPLGCWDWWGYSGKNYLEQSGPQLNAVRRMIVTLVD